MLKPKTSKTCLITGGVLLILAMLIPAPSARFLGLILAALCAAVPALFGAGRRRWMALILLILAAGAAVWTYPEFKEHMNRYRESVRSRSK